MGLLVAGVLAGLSGSALAAPAQALPPYGAKDHQHREGGGKFAIDEWKYTVTLDDGTVLMLGYAYIQMWFLPSAVGGYLTVVSPGGGEDRTYVAQVGAEQFRQDIAAPVLAFGDAARIEGPDASGTRLFLRSDQNGGLELDLTLTDAWPGFRVTEPSIQFGDDPDALAEVAVITPRAKVRGRLKDQAGEREVTGTAAAVRVWHGQLLTALFQRISLLTASSARAAVVAMAWEPRPERRAEPHSFWLVSGPKGLMHLERDGGVRDVAGKPFRGCPVPKGQLWEASAGPAKLGVQWSRTLQAFALTDKMKPITRAAVRAVMGDPAFVRGSVKAEVALGEGPPLRMKGVLRLDCSDPKK